MKAYRVVFDNSYAGPEWTEEVRHAIIATGDDIVSAYAKVVAHADAMERGDGAAVPGSARVREFVQMEEEAI